MTSDHMIRCRSRIRVGALTQYIGALTAEISAPIPPARRGRRTVIGAPKSEVEAQSLHRIQERS